ncbi:hypothetical protein J3F83DRAFT_278425 [Trichoderma novae-zelandiae]
MSTPRCLVLLLLLVLGRLVFAEPTVGAALFGWPPPRPFNYYTERLAPCGSPVGAGERVEVPIEEARVAFFAQRDLPLELAISYSQDPTSQDDFETLRYNVHRGSLVCGTTCILLGDPIPGVAHGRNATLQFRYLSDYDVPQSYEYRYSCADITFSDKVDNSNGDICVNKTLPTAYDRLSGPPPDVKDEHDNRPLPHPFDPPTLDRGNYVEVELDRPPVPSWVVALAAVGGCFLVSVIYLLVYKFIYEPRQRRKLAKAPMWVPPPA